MTRVLLIAAALTASSAASAGTYVGLGIGTGASVSDSAGSTYLADGRSDRFAIGYRFMFVSLEGAYTGYSLVQTNTAGDGELDSRTLQAALKLSYGLGNNFEVFGRAGLLRTWLNSSGDGTMALSGNGYTLSAGFEYRLNLGIAAGSLFVDYSHNQATLDDGNQDSVDQTASMWTLGVNLSL